MDNRSTATTILAVRSLIELQRDRNLAPEARKLLSFTDNRQDASLQAGHFNDFVQVALLRSSLYRACAGADGPGLRHGELSRRVLDAMHPRFEDYAADPDVRGPARQHTRDALRRVIEYFLYRDLERGWRVTAPNLEDCGLLRFEYEGLGGEDGLLGETELWESGFSVQEGRESRRFVEAPAALRLAPAEAREEILRTLLDVLRRALAVKVDVLDPRKQHDLVERTKPRLLEGTVWYLDDERELTGSVVAWPRPRRQGERGGFFVSSHGAYGQYVKRTLESHPAPEQPRAQPLGHADTGEPSSVARQSRTVRGRTQPLRRADTGAIIRFLFLALKRYGIVEQVRTGRDGDDPGYQLNADALRWLPGDGEDRPPDRTRLLEEGGLPEEVNRYFVECYRRFVDLRGVLEAREHTAQVVPEDRLEREERFREGDLPLLFCSPTMELGVDIAQLNLFGSDAVEDPRRLATDTMKRCPACGYAHLQAGETHLAEVCDRCGAALDTPSRIDALVRLQNVSLSLAQRITCDEEERQRFGYHLVTAYRFPEVDGRLERKDAEVRCGDARALTLSYGDATDLYRVNLGWTHQDGSQPRGFNLDLERGYWSRNQADVEDRDDATAEGRIVRVVPFVRDTRNALVMRFEPARAVPEMAGLQAAFKQAVQQHFQIEPRELSCEAMPSPRERREILFYEASEGGAGVLRQLAESPAMLPALARRALAICHYDPDTLEDRGAHRCGRACYECLLDYGNQPDHRILDRALIRDVLAELARSECRPAGGAGSRAERLAALRKRCDSRLEQRWLDMVGALGLRLPSDAQYAIPGHRTRPDFFYREANAAIYIDGPPHDAPDQAREDRARTRALIEVGYIVIRFHHEADWPPVFRRHTDVFGAVSE